jgi:general secretion pathway protein J
MLAGVKQFELHYLTRRLAWVDEWPAPADDAIPRAVLLRLVLASGEQIERIFALQ